MSGRLFFVSCFSFLALPIVSGVPRARGGEVLQAASPIEQPYPLYTDTSTLFREWPMLTAHDAASTYLETGLVDKWVKTQPDGGFPALLNCGARALDVRPKVDGDKLVMHHGSFTIDKPLEDAVTDVLTWADQNPSELVVIYISHCDGDQCSEKVKTLLDGLNVTSIDGSDNCLVLEHLTVKDAWKMGRSRVSGGGGGTATRTGSGSVVAVHSPCVYENYDPDIHCNMLYLLAAGAEPPPARCAASEDACFPSVAQVRDSVARAHGLTEEAAGGGPGEAGAEVSLVEYSCFADSTTKARPMGALREYLDGVLLTPPAKRWGFRPSNRLWMAQAHWQSDAQSIAAGEYLGSSLLLNEARAHLNSNLAVMLRSGVWKGGVFGLWESDNVCDGGPGLREALVGNRTIPSASASAVTRF